MTSLTTNKSTPVPEVGKRFFFHPKCPGQLWTHPTSCSVAIHWGLQLTNHLTNTKLNKYVKSRATNQIVGSRRLKEEVGFRFQPRPCGIGGGRNGNETCFLWVLYFSPASITPQVLFIYSFVIEHYIVSEIASVAKQHVNNAWCCTSTPTNTLVTRRFVKYGDIFRFFF